jgi:hypothetical protein
MEFGVTSVRVITTLTVGKEVLQLNVVSEPVEASTVGSPKISSMVEAKV